ncbi:hypothetical protein GCM10010261_65690 [Streptomyces pilosus]|uniref:hypothetical protein n=1 Tax=Streptomyces pilosus TaxID=28893 RepID=UPI0019BC33D8|nr:hypothetical protein [Streptomyces pilosus]GGV70454.1 hypothetical protein GCM10010261_65690 [Streptomyces pilosus]
MYGEPFGGGLKGEELHGKHKAHGRLCLALTDERGNLIWFSTARPRRFSDFITTRHHKIAQHLRDAGLGALAGLGFVGVDDSEQPQDGPVISLAAKPPATTASPPRRRKRTGC